MSSFGIFILPLLLECSAETVNNKNARNKGMFDIDESDYGEQTWRVSGLSAEIFSFYKRFFDKNYC